MKLFEHTPRENPNDPFLINPRGIRVQVPEEKVRELLLKGFTLVDPKWVPVNIPQTQTQTIRDVPLPLHQLRQEVVDVVDVWEVEEL